MTLGNLPEDVFKPYDVFLKGLGDHYSKGPQQRTEQKMTEWLKANPKAWEGWLSGVTTVDGMPGLEAVKKCLKLCREAAPAPPRGEDRRAVDLEVDVGGAERDGAREEGVEIHAASLHRQGAVTT